MTPDCLWRFKLISGYISCPPPRFLCVSVQTEDRPIGPVQVSFWTDQWTDCWSGPTPSQKSSVLCIGPDRTETEPRLSIPNLTYLTDLLLPASDAPLHDLIDKVYPDIQHLHSNDENDRLQYFSERVILAARNVDVDAINDIILDRLCGDGKIYLSADSAFQDGGALDSSVPQEYLNMINLAGMPLHNTTLKIGSPIILLRNLEQAAGLCNGTSMIVTKLKERVIETMILVDPHAGERAFISPISLDTPASSGLPFTL